MQMYIDTRISLDDMPPEAYHEMDALLKEKIRELVMSFKFNTAWVESNVKENYYLTTDINQVQPFNEPNLRYKPGKRVKVLSFDSDGLWNVRVGRGPVFKVQSIDLERIV
jgi:hypothetical protein